MQTFNSFQELAAGTGTMTAFNTEQPVENAPSVPPITPSQPSSDRTPIPEWGNTLIGRVDKLEGRMERMEGEMKHVSQGIKGIRQDIAKLSGNPQQEGTGTGIDPRQYYNP